MLRIADKIATGIKGAKVIPGRLQPDNKVTKLEVRFERVQIKIEVTPVLRGIAERCAGWRESAVKEWMDNPFFYSIEDRS